MELLYDPVIPFWEYIERNLKYWFKEYMHPDV